MRNLWTRIEHRARRIEAATSGAPVRRGLYDLHPELAFRQHLTSLLDGNFTGTDLPYDYGQAAADYTRSIWLRRAVDILAQNFQALPVHVVNEDDEPQTGHPLAEPLANGNDTSSQSQVWGDWLKALLLGGEAGLEITFRQSKTPAEFFVRNASQITVLADKARRAYYGIAGFKIKTAPDIPAFRLEPQEFIFHRFTNPMLPYRGLSPISAVRYSIVIDQLAQAWSRLFFQNSARPDYAVIAPQGLARSEREALEAKLMDKFGGPGGWHKPIVLEQGIADIKTFSFAPKDLEWLEQRKFSRDEVAAIVGVPDEMMGFGENTYTNFPTARKVLWGLTLLPLIRFRDDGLATHFRRYGWLKPTERILTDLTGVPELQEDLKEKAEVAKIFVGLGYTLNDVDERLRLGFGEKEYGSEPYSGKPTGLALSLSEAQRLVDGVAQAAPPRLARLPSGGAVRRSGVSDFGSEAHEKRLKQVEDRIADMVEAMQRQIKREFQRQQTEVGRKLRNDNQLGRGARIADDQVLKVAVGQLFNLQEEIARFKEIFLDVVARMFGKAGGEEAEDLGEEFNADSSRVQAAIERVLNAFAEKTNQTTYRELVDLFKDAEAAGESIPEMMERLSAYFAGRKSDAETHRIAQTTMTAANNSASIEAWRASSKQLVAIWVSALLPTSRPAHTEAHGQRRTPGDTFDVGGEALDFPGDPDGRPDNIIECHCTLAVEEKEE